MLPRGQCRADPHPPHVPEADPVRSRHVDKVECFRGCLPGLAVDACRTPGNLFPPNPGRRCRPGLRGAFQSDIPGFYIPTCPGRRSRVPAGGSRKTGSGRGNRKGSNGTAEGTGDIVQRRDGRLERSRHVLKNSDLGGCRLSPGGGRRGSYEDFSGKKEEMCGREFPV